MAAANRRSLRFAASVGPKRVSSRMSSNQVASIRNTRAEMQAVIKNYERLVGHINATTPQILYDALEPTFELSKVYCPKDTGALVESGYIEVTTFRGIPTVGIGYGAGGDPEYAVRVHENLEWNHKAPTRAKWLQVAIAEDESNIEARIVSDYRRIFA